MNTFETGCFYDPADNKVVMYIASEDDMFFVQRRDSPDPDHDPDQWIGIFGKVTFTVESVGLVWATIENMNTRNFLTGEEFIDMFNVRTRVAVASSVVVR